MAKLHFFLWLSSIPLYLYVCIHIYIYIYVCVCVYTHTHRYISSVQSLSRVWLFAIPWTAAHQASLSITNSQSLLKLMSTELVMPSNYLILCHPPFLLPSIFPSIRVFSNESVLHIRWLKYWSFSSVSVLPMNICMYVCMYVYIPSEPSGIVKYTYTTSLFIRLLVDT